MTHRLSEKRYPAGFGTGRPLGMRIQKASALRGKMCEAHLFQKKETGQERKDRKRRELSAAFYHRGCYSVLQEG